jgi:arylsulfatase A-like enzyme
MGEHGGWQHDQSVYDELIRVPLIIRFPVGQFAGKRVKTPVSLIDVMPTVFDYLKQAGLARGVSGRSLMPLIRDEASAPRGPRITAMRNNKKKYFRPWKERRGDVNVVVRDGSWKGILNAEVNGFELYDLSSDAGEKSELSGRQPQRAAALRELATRWLANCGPLDTSVGREALENLDQSYRKTLETLGYVGGDDNGAHAATQPGTAPGKPQP